MEFLGYFAGIFEPTAFLFLLIGTIGGLFLGFYTAAAIAFLAIYRLYDPTSFGIRSWCKQITIAALFVAAIYGVFFMLLQVQAPPGILL